MPVTVVSSMLPVPVLPCPLCCCMDPAVSTFPAGCLAAGRSACDSSVAGSKGIVTAGAGSMLEKREGEPFPGLCAFGLAVRPESVISSDGVRDALSREGEGVSVPLPGDPAVHELAAEGSICCFIGISTQFFT